MSLVTEDIRKPIREAVAMQDGERPAKGVCRLRVSDHRTTLTQRGTNLFHTSRKQYQDATAENVDEFDEEAMHDEVSKPLAGND